jgi:N-6 DNA Methylase
MAPTTKNQVALSLDLIESRVSRLRSQLGCLGQERDTQGSDFWYLRLGTDELEIPNTRPIAIGFDDRLNDLTETEIKDSLTAKDSEIYRHYLDRTSENQPVMYLLYPSSEESGRVAFILPQEGGLKQRDIRIFELGSRELSTRLERFKIVPIAQNILCSVPLVERVFYDPIETSKDLAQQLAKVAKAIEQIIPQVYRQEHKDGYLHKLLASFQDELLPFLKLEAENDKDYSFADIYAQTVAYSLFTARVFSHLKWQKDLQLDPTVKEPLFDRESAWQQLPETNPFLRKLFEDISKQKAEDLGDGLIAEIANIFGILRAAKMEAILSDFSQTGNRDDIIIHFYEPFLAAYNPKLKKNRGVYYTPESVVSYMVRSVDILLKDKFHKPLGLLKDYYQVDGQPLGEKNSKWLQDDYVKFIRFSQWRIQQTGMGILAFITNHGYLDNPTFRGMRRSLDKTFDEMYVLDLHGNSKKKEVAPDGSKDENVFDIQQGVAIGLMVKLPVQE